ncbi:hypothetical protein IE53DRAFT_200538 [Violaceomyces palustris]|uniref:Uncharacterized protein n=1 Tax=Violaceomyces palustris TaxID=1673888 RepID=A0ACD0NRB2_9BASI|nr:hypothetical protein IE53DRAFT_200538 [Violaceomyces palustris]
MESIRACAFARLRACVGVVNNHECLGQVTVVSDTESVERVMTITITSIHRPPSPSPRKRPSSPAPSPTPNKWSPAHASKVFPSPPSWPLFLFWHPFDFIFTFASILISIVQQTSHGLVDRLTLSFMPKVSGIVSTTPLHLAGGRPAFDCPPTSTCSSSA